MLTIGIDPGVNGGIVILNNDGTILEKLVMPTIVKGVFDLHGFIALIKKYKNDSIAYIEDVHSIKGSGAGANFNFGGITWTMRAVCACFDIPFVLVTPKVWQKEMFQGVSEIRKPSTTVKRKDKKTNEIKIITIKGRRDCKAMALLASKRLFPKADLRATERCKKFHDGIVDSLLIAEFGRRNY